MGNWVFLISLQAMLFALLIICGYTDLVRRKVYDWATLPSIAFGITLNLVAATADQEASFIATTGWRTASLGFAVGGGVFFLAFLFGGVGGGDVKLAAAIGAIKGFPFIVGAIFWSSIVGAVMALGMAAMRGRLRRTVKGSAKLMFRPGSPDVPPDGKTPEQKETPEETTIPYGFAITIGTMFYWTLVELGGQV